MLHRLAIMAAVGLTVVVVQAVKQDLGVMGPPYCLYARRGYYARGCSTEYWACAGKQLFTLKCDPGFYFNPTNNKCDYKVNVPSCAHDMTVNEHSACEPDTFVAHISGCSTVFWHCVQGKFQHFECPSGTYFNPAHSACDYHANIPSCAVDSVDYMDPTPKSVDPSGSDDYMDPTPKSAKSDDYMDPTPRSANPSGSDDYMDPTPRSVSASRSDDYMDPTPRSADASGSDDYMDPTPHNADSSRSDDYMDSTPRSNDYMDSTPGSDDYMDPTPGSVYSSVAPTVTSETTSSASSIDCHVMGNGYHSKGCSSEVWYCNNGKLETHECNAGQYFNSGDNMCYDKLFVLACGGEPDYPSGADYPEDSTTESPSTPSTATAPTTTSVPTRPSPTTALTDTVATRTVPVMAIRPTPSDYHKHSYTTFFGITLVLFSILCILYLICGNVNFTCSASMNVGSSTNAQDKHENAECKKSGMYNIV